MKLHKLAFLAGVFLLLPAIPGVGAPRSVPDGAYVREPVSSVEELAAHINKDPVVRNRFAQHFGIPPARLTAYIRENVVITRVSRSTPQRVYIVTRSGRTVPQSKVLRSGTPIFAMRDTGEPLLVLSCGNPVLKRLPPRERVKANEPLIYQAVRPNEMPPPVPLAAAPAVAPPPPPPPVALVTPAAPVTPPVTAPPAAVVARSPLPLLLGGLFLRRNEHHAPPPPIPEPGGAATVVASGLLPAAGWAMIKLRSRRRTENKN